MTEKEFCKLHTSYYGEPIDNPKQIALIQFTGEELKEYVEHFIRLCEVSRSLPTEETINIESFKKSNYKYNELNSDLSTDEIEGFRSGCNWYKRQIKVKR